jgi:hypothetical protein
MNHLTNKKSILILAITSFLLILEIFLYILDNETKYISIFSFLITLFFISKFYKSQILAIYFCFCILYNFEACVYFFNDIKLTAWPDFQQKNYINFVLLIQTIFTYTLGNLLDIKINTKSTQFDFPELRNNYIFITNAAICILILFFGTTGDNILVSGQYGSAEKSPLNEYFLIFYLFLTLSSFKVLHNYFVFFISITYIIKNLLFGGRIEVFQISLMIFLLNDNLKKYFKTKYILLFFMFGFYISRVIGNIRDNPIQFINGNFYEFFYFSNVFNYNVPYLSSNQGDVLQSSGRIIGLIDNGFLDIPKRIASFFIFCFSSFTISSFLPDYAIFARYKQDTFQSGGGGLIGAYAYGWLGYIGPVLFGIFISYCINSTLLNFNKYLKIFGILLLVSFPRWYSYNPMTISKFCIYGLIIFYIYKIKIYNKNLAI